MATRTWKGGTAKFNAASAWTPAGAPVSGDTLSIVTGTADARGLTLSGLTVNLGGSVAAGTSTAAILLLQSSTIAANTTVQTYNNLNSSVGPAISVTTIQAEGNNVNKGKIEVAGYIQPGARVPHIATLTVDVGHSVSGTFTNAGTLRSDWRNTLVVHGQAAQGQLQNSGLIEADGFVKLDIAVIGTGRMQFGTPAFLGGPPELGQIEATTSVATGQTIDFKDASGTNSYGLLTLDDPRNFHALIADFVASAPSLGYAHPDRIALPGFKATSLHYQGNAAGGTLTVDAGTQVIAQLRFAGSYTTNSFRIVPLTGGGTGIELKYP